mgnify:CR=1 FL=1|jgi:hypothetical protein
MMSNLPEGDVKVPSSSSTIAQELKTTAYSEDYEQWTSKMLNDLLDLQPNKMRFYVQAATHNGMVENLADGEKIQIKGAIVNTNLLTVDRPYIELHSKCYKPVCSCATTKKCAKQRVPRFNITLKDCYGVEHTIGYIGSKANILAQGVVRSSRSQLKNQHNALIGKLAVVCVSRKGDFLNAAYTTVTPPMRNH